MGHKIACYAPTSRILQELPAGPLTPLGTPVQGVALGMALQGNMQGIMGHPWDKSWPHLTHWCIR